MRRSSSSDRGPVIGLPSRRSFSEVSRRSVLVLNTGSSSLKWVVLDAESDEVQHKGEASWEDSQVSRHELELRAALERAPDVDAVGHRLVHGGWCFREVVVVDDAVREQIIQLAELAPLHNPAAVAGI